MHLGQRPRGPPPELTPEEGMILGLYLVAVYAVLHAGYVGLAALMLLPLILAMGILAYWDDLE